MVNLIRQLGPLAIVIALIAMLIGFLLSQASGIGNWLFAAFLFGHGWVHTMYVMPRGESKPQREGANAWPFTLDRSWLMPRGSASLRGFGIVLVTITAIAFSLAALNTIPLFLPAGAWAAVVATGAGASILLMAVFFSPALLIGFAIDIVLLWVVLARAWLPG